MAVETPFSKRLLNLQRQKTRYNKVVAVLCKGLKGSNKSLLRAMVKDLVYRFSPGENGKCRSSIIHDGRVWNADSYETLAEHYSKTIKKTVSAKTVQRYTDNLKAAGILQTSRHFFAGKNMLHRSVNSQALEALLFVAELEAFDPIVVKKAINERDMCKIHDLIKETKIRDIKRRGETPSLLDLLDMRSVTEIDAEVEAVITAGDSLFRLGKLLQTKKKVTQQARARIRELVKEGILSVDVIFCLKDGIVNGELDDFRNMGLNLTPRYWPQWLNLYFARDGVYGDEESLDLAAYYFLGDPADSPWMEGESLERYLRVIQLREAIEARGRYPIDPRSSLEKYADDDKKNVL